MIDNLPSGLSFEDELHLLEHGYEYTPNTGWSEERKDKLDRARTLFIESVLQPDTKLRGCAHNQGCYDELMEVRAHVLHYLGFKDNETQT
tara:strand:+ start:1062 stop:1331 length:270 start_codon:yes stop_codon:yes gene_type:complete